MVYRIVGGIKFYQRKEIKDVIAYLRLILNFNDVVSLERAIDEPKRSIGARTMEKWLLSAKKTGKDPIEFGLGIKDEKLENPEKFIAIPKSKIDEIAKFCDFIRRMREIQPRIALSDFIEKVISESGYEKMLLAEGVEGEMRWENVKELATVARKYDKNKDEYEDILNAFLEEIALASDTDNVDQNQDAVHLMTLHSVKDGVSGGVYSWARRRILPHSRSMLSYDEMEEERRLMYVGLTRAKEEIYLLFTRQRTLFGSTQMNAPSRFLEDIPEKFMDTILIMKLSKRIRKTSEKQEKKEFFFVLESRQFAIQGRRKSEARRAWRRRGGFGSRRYNCGGIQESRNKKIVT